MSIQPLPSEVIAQIKSATAITSLNAVVCELVKNSLDAAATQIEIVVDYGKGGCTVEDNGLGIQPAEFGENGGLGKLYHSSKLHSTNSLHGGRGTFLASLSAMSLLAITSHHHLHRSHNTLSMHRSEAIARQLPAPQQHLTSFGHGTRVTVRDLFGNMPVRVKQRAILSEKSGANVKDWEELKRWVVLLLLAWPGDIGVTAREVGTEHKLVVRPQAQPSETVTKAGISRVCSILSQSTLMNRDEKDSWVSVTASSLQVKIRGAISLLPYATKRVQFISFGIRPIIATDGQSILHDEINRLFVNSAFGNEEALEELDATELARRVKDARYKGDGFTNKELKGGKKGVERWPMFYIDIQGKDNTQDLDVDHLFDDTKNSLSSTIELLQAMVYEFLSKNHFRPKSTCRKSKPAIHHPTASRDSTSSARRSPFKTPSASSISSKRKRMSPGATKEVSRQRLNTFDPLGTNVRLPSFRQSASNSELPFDAWSRVKSGSSKTKKALLMPAGSPSLTNGSDIHRPTTAPPQSDIVTFSVPIRCSTADIERQAPSPLVSKSGKIIRRPFQDVVEEATQKTRSKPIEVSSRTTQNEAIDEATDEIVTWMNPITKIESKINKRTGLTIPNHKTTLNTRYTSASSLSGTQPLKRTISSGTQEPSPWLGKILKNWENPIFLPTEPSIKQISFAGHDTTTQEILHWRRHQCSQIDIDRAFKESSAGIHGRISKEGLKNAEVISQIDNKFILVKVKTSDTHQEHQDSGTLLVLIDQHAADERIRIESLMEELCTPPHPNDIPTTPISGIKTAPIEKPLIFSISSKEASLFKTHIQHFANWGIFYTLSPSKTNPPQPQKENENQNLTITSLPPPILGRSTLDPKIIISLLRTEIWHLHDNPRSHTTLHPTPLPPHSTSTSTPSNQTTSSNPTWLILLPTIPQGVLSMLNSRACRSSIMFNDVLTKAQCEVLVGKLGGCRFPFICAHGRPSLVPVVEVGAVGLGLGVGGMGIGGLGGLGLGGSNVRRGGEGEEENFVRSVRKWKEKLGRG